VSTTQPLGSTGCTPVKCPKALTVAFKQASPALNYGSQLFISLTALQPYSEGPPGPDGTPLPTHCKPFLLWWWPPVLSG